MKHKSHLINHGKVNTVLRGKFIAFNVYIKGKNGLNYLSSLLYEKFRKKSRNKPKLNKTKIIIK